MINKIKFKVLYTPNLINKIGEMMKKFDLGIEGLEYPTEEIWSLDTSTKIDRKYIYKMKKAIKEAVEETGAKIISINKIK